MVKFQLRHGNDLLAMDCIRQCDVSVMRQLFAVRDCPSLCVPACVSVCPFVLFLWLAALKTFCPKRNRGFMISVLAGFMF